MEITHLSPQFAVAPQLHVEDLAEAVARGFRGIVNNRPDGEAPDQPESGALAAEAQRLGLAYRHIPIVPGEITEEDARALLQFLSERSGPVLAFCRTGTRSRRLWDLGRQLSGTPA